MDSWNDSAEPLTLLDVFWPRFGVCSVVTVQSRVQGQLGESRTITFPKAWRQELSVSSGRMRQGRKQGREIPHPLRTWIFLCACSSTLLLPVLWDSYFHHKDAAFLPGFQAQFQFPSELSAQRTRGLTQGLLCRAGAQLLDEFPVLELILACPSWGLLF